MLFVNKAAKILAHFELGWNQRPILQRIHRGQSSLQLQVAIRPFDEAHTFPFFLSSSSKSNFLSSSSLLSLSSLSWSKNFALRARKNDAEFEPF